MTSVAERWTLGRVRKRAQFPVGADRSSVRPALAATALPVLLVAAWQLATAGRDFSLIPPPTQVALALYDLAVGGIRNDFFSGTLLAHTIASSTRVFGGFALAVLVALPLGLMIGRIASVRQALDPTLQLLRPIPVTAWLPLAMIIFGIGPRSAIFLVFIAAFYPILVNTIFGVRAVEERLFEAASMLGCKPSAQFSRVVLPAALPAIFAGLRLGLGSAWMIIVIGEMTGVPTGLGAIIMEGRQLSRTEVVISGMVVIGLAGFLTDRAIVALGRRLLAWSPNHA